ncbi:Xaa-Pro peptidase family protein [Geomonas sp. RF6]|uniref:M24 family metallopeptidase n=1 Tax=Geomonas sp. RF6 TaxID=2897342 RepID=UPI001E2CA393|nr:Xaa-Pro peptidase family protein [Geomonas sp. RF6]UFS69659.1 Xaa-Pro peptidase family protein [Geomonas sp. RF6]
MLDNRISAARGALKGSGADLLIVTSLSNIRYISGFTGSSALLVVSEKEAFLLTDSRYTSQAAAEAPGVQVIEYAQRLEGVKRLLQEQGAQRIAFEAAHTTVAAHKDLCSVLPNLEFIPVDKELEALRTVKDASELRLLEQTAQIASEALQEILPQVRPGAVERDVALALEIAMRHRGAHGISFDFIVASGERGALPHGKASDKVIAYGELVTLDYGALYQGYCSDETVTVCVGKPDPRQVEVYETVRGAQEAAIKGARPGMTLKEVDALARSYIESRGFGSYFGHGLGHGVGIDIHEHPTVSPRGEGTVTEGMVFTIEPGIYIPGWGGVRIEDTVVVEQDGCRCITKVPKDLIVL